ncbi:uncharacterized protein [Typha angustifolia]|uniref:uncharacterized protein n=1 Tax=Typha angustifolia TaxID=59011 RepID=UPI003C2B0E2C
MGRRSDFAQKLLDDLRLRKEKLGFATSQSQRPTTTTTTAVAVSGDSYGNSRRFLRRSGEATSSSLSGKSMVKKDRQLGLVVKHHRAAGPEGLSQDVVPFKRGTNLGDTMDMPMALALALSYSGKLQNIEVFSKAKVGNEFIMHRGSISFSDRNSQYPFAPHLQVSEISRGVQKLNEILTACYSGTSIGRSSIEIGRELLRGAVDLEESLRMLIMLQEASDSMVGSQGSQVLLLKDKEEDDSSSKKAKQKKTHRTTFSFDGSYSDSRKTKAAATSNSSRSSPNASMQSISHRRSSSCGPGTKPDAQFSITTRKYEEVGQFPDSSCNSAASSRTTEKFVQIGLNPTNAKVRIPNVVARLMGLEELPPPKEEVKMAEVSKAAKSVRETKEARTVKLEENKYLQAKDTRDTKAAKVVEVTREKASLASSTNSGSISLASKSSPKPHFSMEYSKKDEQSKKEAVQSSKTTETKEQKSQGKAGEITHDVKQSTQANKARVTAKQYLRYHEEAIRKKDFLLKDQNRMAIARSQQKKSALAQEKISHTLQGSATGREQRERSRAELITGARSDPKLRNIGKSSNEVGRQKTLSCTQAVAEKKSAGRNANKDQLRRQSTINHTRSINSTYHGTDRKAETEILGDYNQLKTDTCQILVTVVNKPTHIPTLEEIDQTDITVHRTESNKNFQDSHKICEQSTPTSHRLKEQDFILDQLENRSEERTIKVEEISQKLDSKHYDKVDNEAASISRATLPDACRRLTAETNNLDIISKASDIQQTPQVPLKNDEEVELPNLRKEQSEGSLTEKQQLLMEVLLKDYQFLTTAQTLFQVEIPLGILQASEKVCQSKDNKLLLDCGHELMRRKSKREGVTLLLKRAGVRCLDALIRELNHEIESLDFPRKTQGDDYDTVERLHKMLEREIPNKNPDANCMWDFGWNSTTLAAVQIDEIVKEMEKYVLKGLIDELARDLMELY